MIANFLIEKLFLECHPTNGQTLKCEDQLCFCDTIVTEVCSSTLNYTGLCTYSENLESSVGTLLISKTCPQGLLLVFIIFKALIS